jgi:hypothetical protein
MRMQGSRALLTVLALATVGLPACSDMPSAPQGTDDDRMKAGPDPRWDPGPHFLPSLGFTESERRRSGRPWREA